MSSLAKLSLCIVVKDRVDGLGRTLASVAKVVDEMILVDISTGEETAAIAKEWGAKVYSVSGGCQVKALQWVAPKVTGEWILVLHPEEELVASREQLQKLASAYGIDGYFFEKITWGPEMGYRPFLQPQEIRFVRKSRLGAILPWWSTPEQLFEHKGKGLGLSNLAVISEEPSYPPLQLARRGSLEVISLMREGLEQAERQEWKASLSSFAGVLKKLRADPRLEAMLPAYRCYYLLGASHQQLGNTLPALNCYAKASSLQPLFVGAFSATSQLLPSVGKFSPQLLTRCLAFVAPDLQVSISRRLQLAGRPDVALYGALGALYQMAGGHRGQRHNCRTIWPCACEVCLQCLKEVASGQKTKIADLERELFEMGQLVVSLPEEVLLTKPRLVDQWRTAWVHQVLDIISGKAG